MRQAALELAAYLKSQPDKEDASILEVFSSTPKPKSVRKGSTSHNDKADFTPLKPKSLKSLLKDLLQQ